MYHHILLFVIVSDNDRIEKILHNINPLEDCDYIFKTVHDIDKVGSIRPDVSIIYDCLGSRPYNANSPENVECTAVFAADSPMLSNAQTISSLNDIWIMPDGTYNEQLLTAYFERLAARMKRYADSRKQGICFHTLINSVPNITWFKDTEGTHLIVNDSFCEMVGKTREQIYKQGHCYIWDASREDEEICLTSDRAIMDSRKTNVFEEVIKTKTDMLMLKSFKSPLIDVDGRLLGTCGIAHDVTELQNINSEFNMFLDSIPFAVIMEDTNGIVINKNMQFDQYFPEFFDIIGKSSSIWKNSLSTHVLPNGKQTEVSLHYGRHELTLLLEEEPMMDIFHRVRGKIITLTDITEERNISKYNEHRANTDFLTDLNNRRGLEKHLAKIKDDENIALVMVDLDNFKQVNDTLGHDAGDKALVITAQILKECFKGDFVARMGGDEFIVAASKQSEESIKQKAQLLLEKMSRAESEHIVLKNVTASIGIVFADRVPEEQRKSFDVLKQIADEELYAAKSGGKNRYHIFGE